jgi:hypothetical protein
MCGALVPVPVGTLGISSTDFDLKNPHTPTTVTLQARFNPTSCRFQPTTSMQQLYIMSDPVSCTKNTINKKKWHVANKRLKKVLKGSKPGQARK